jgi:hypothetical protein
VKLRRSVGSHTAHRKDGAESDRAVGSLAKDLGNDTSERSAEHSSQRAMCHSLREGHHVQSETTRQELWELVWSMPLRASAWRATHRGKDIQAAAPPPGMKRTRLTEPERCGSRVTAQMRRGNYEGLE